MKNKQINFFLTPQDLNDLKAYLQEMEWGIIPFCLETSTPVFTNELPARAFFVLKRQMSDVKTKFVASGNFFKVKLLESPVIEFRISAVEPQTNKMSRGRIFLTTEFYDSDYLREKKDDFRNASKNLLAWFRRQLNTVRDDGFDDILMSYNAKVWANENNGTFSRNNVNV